MKIEDEETRAELDELHRGMKLQGKCMMRWGEELIQLHKKYTLLQANSDKQIHKLCRNIYWLCFINAISLTLNAILLLKM